MMFRRLTICASISLLMVGCQSTSIYNEKISPYMPDLDGRYLGSVGTSGSAVSSGGQSGSVAKGVGDKSITMLKRGDKITIYLYGTEPSTQLEDVIDDNGNVNLPLLGSTKIGGLTTDQAEKAIEKAYIEGGFYVQMQVSVVKLFEGEFYVSGEVNNKQGVYPLSGDTTLLEAIARAGDFTVFAKQTKVKLIRDGNVTTYNVKNMKEGKETPPLLRPNDIINVEKSAW